MAVGFGCAAAVIAGRFFGRDDGRGQHLVDALAVHVHHLEAPVFPVERVAGGGHAAQQQHDHAGECLVAGLFLFGHAVQLQRVLQFGNGDEAIEQPGTIGTLQGPAVVVIR